MTAAGQQFHGGVITGLAGSQVAGDTYSGYKKAGIFVGGYVSLNVAEKYCNSYGVNIFQR